MGLKLSIRVSSPSSYTKTYLFYPNKIIKKKMKHEWIINRRTLKARNYHMEGLAKGYFVKISPNRYILEQDLERFIRFCRK